MIQVKPVRPPERDKQEGGCALSVRTLARPPAADMAFQHAQRITRTCNTFVVLQQLTQPHWELEYKQSSAPGR